MSSDASRRQVASVICPHSESKRMYIKYEFKTGEGWKKLSGITMGESFECVNDDEGSIPIEQPFDLNYTAK